MPSTKPARPKLLNNRERTRRNTKEKQPRIFTDLHEHFLILIICVHLRPLFLHCQPFKLCSRPLASIGDSCFLCLSCLVSRSLACIRGCLLSVSKSCPPCPSMFIFRFLSLQISTFLVRYSIFSLPSSRYSVSKAARRDALRVSPPAAFTLNEKLFKSRITCE